MNSNWAWPRTRITSTIEAIHHFQKATELDPANVNAHLYLATSYVSQYIPGVYSDDNNETAKSAIFQYQKVLDLNATNQQKINSAKGIAYVYLNMKQWDESRKYYRIASDLDTNDPENYYSLGVIDWMQCYQPRMEERARLGMQPDARLNSQESRAEKGLRRASGKELVSDRGRDQQFGQSDPASSGL